MSLGLRRELLNLELRLKQAFFLRLGTLIPIKKKETVKKQVFLKKNPADLKSQVESAIDYR